MEGLVVLALIIGAYLFPTLVAGLRDHNLIGVFIVNLVVGWTVVGWIVALVMACGAKQDRRDTLPTQTPTRPR